VRGEAGEDEPLEVVRCEGFAEEEALGVVDVFVAEVVELVDGFDAFGEGFEAEVAAELDEDADQRVGFGERLIASVKARSILIVSIENCWREPSEE
jgi:hypothetical protein